MSRVTSLTSMPEKQLNRWIKRVALLLVVGIVAFVAFYAIDRFRMPAAPIVDQQLALVEEAVRADPADTTARGQLADRYAAKGRYDEAIVQYTVLIDANKEVELASLGRAQAYLAIAEYDLAIPDFEKVVEIASGGEMANVDKTLAAAYYGLGTIALAQDRPQDAIEPLTKALAIQRTNADALYAISKAYLATDQAEKAIEPLNLAITLVPIGWAEPYAALETVYSKTGETDLAEWAGAMAAFATGDHASAEKRLLAIADGEHALEASVGLGLVSESKGDTATAADWYLKALALDPENMSAKLGFSRVTLPAATPLMPVASPTGETN